MSPNAPPTTGPTTGPSTGASSPTASATAAHDKGGTGGISLTQIVGGAFAAVASAAAASYLGVAGTFVGAALGSVVYTIVAAIYSSSVHRAAKVSRTLVVRRVIAPEPEAGSAPASPSATLSPTTPSGNGDGQVTTRTYRAGAGEPIWRRLRWKPLAVAAGLVFVAAMAVITISELALGHPLSNPKGSGVTITDLGGSKSDRSTSPSSPSVTSPGSSSETATATSTGTPGATPTQSVAPGPTPTGQGDATSTAPQTQPGASAPSGATTSTSIGVPQPTTTP